MSVGFLLVGGSTANMGLTLLICLTLVIAFLLKYIWERRWQYYCFFKIPGPACLPYIDNIMFLNWKEKGKKRKIVMFLSDYSRELQRFCETQPSVFRLWVGTDLFIVNSEPTDVEILLNTFLDKLSLYRTWREITNEAAIVVAPVDRWKTKRKLLNPSFNTRVINSFHHIFVKYSKKTVTMIDGLCGQEVTNLFSEIWKMNIDITLETVLDVQDASTMEKRYETMANIVRIEEIFVERMRKPWLFNDLLWRFSSLRKELMSCFGCILDTGTEIIKKKLKENCDDLSNDLIKNKVSMNLMYHAVMVDRTMTEDDLQQDFWTLFVGSSETGAIVVTFVLLVLGLFPEIQDKIYEEILLVQDDKDLAELDISRMTYLECVIKETMRILPPGPLLLRYVDKDIRLGSYTYPAGSHLLIPVGYLHRRPDIWPDPMKFDPGRFSPEEIKKRPRSAYLPFSFGPRNCIGYKYAMMSMKIILAHVLKHFKVKALNYKSVEEIQYDFHTMINPVGNRVMFERRTD